MKLHRLRAAVLALPLLLGSCASWKKDVQIAEQALTGVEIACALTNAVTLPASMPVKERATLVAQICRFDEALLPAVQTLLASHELAAAHEKALASPAPCSSR